MPKKYKIDLGEITVFKQAVKDVKPLWRKKVRVKLSKKQEVKPARIQKASDLIRLTDKDNIAMVSGEEYITYKQASISAKILRKLRRAQYNVEAKLDLHGMTEHEAKVAVSNFLQICIAQELRVVVVIHGKGKSNKMPVLKNKLNQWLRNVDSVLAFCSASATHGRSGAIYVLLKRRTELE